MAIKLSDTVEDLREELAERDETIAGLRREIEELNEEIDDLNDVIDDLKSDVSDLELERDEFEGDSIKGNSTVYYKTDGNYWDGEMMEALAEVLEKHSPREVANLLRMLSK